MKHKIEKLLFILKGKTIGWSPSGDAFNYKKYIFKEKADKKMSKEYLEKQIELLVKDDEISQQTIINQKQEIERLNNIKKKAINELFNLKDMIYKPETREINFDIQRKISSIIKILGSEKRVSEINLKLKTYDELIFEISRLNTDKYLLEQKLQQKENIIKEVRGIIEKESFTYEHITGDYRAIESDLILEILDKDNKNEITNK